MRATRKSPLRAGTHRGAQVATGMAGVIGNDDGASGSVKVVPAYAVQSGEQRAGCGRAAPAPAPAALPCQNRNNSIQPLPVGGSKYRFQKVTDVAGGTWEKDRDGHLWQTSGDGHHERFFGQPLTGADRKRAFILRRHVEAFVSYWHRSHSLFFTTTDAEGVHPREYARRWNSLLANESQWIRGFVRVLEPQRNRRPHFHNLTATPFDVRPDDFDWDAFAAAQDAYHKSDWATFRAMRERYKASAVPELRELWAWGRKKMPLYGLGRCEILPIRKEGAISEYIGKYLDKGMHHKFDGWKGVRRFETDRRTSREWKRCGRQFSWVSPGARQWRMRCRELALALGIGDTGNPKDLTKKLGPRWAYRLRGVITTGTEEEFTEVCAALRSVTDVHSRLQNQNRIDQ